MTDLNLGSGNWLLVGASTKLLGGAISANCVPSRVTRPEDRVRQCRATIRHEQIAEEEFSPDVNGSDSIGTQNDRAESMSGLLVVQPDSVQADALREALRARTSEDVVVAESLDGALSSIDRRVPDVILLATLIPAAMEDYLITYLGTLPGAGHVQILGLPRLEPADDAVGRRARSRFPWRRRQGSRAAGIPGCDPAVFTQDVVAYLARARALKEEIELCSAYAARSGRPERRSESRFANYEVPWISFVTFGGEPAALINVSSRGALLRTHSRPGHHVLRPGDPDDRERSRVTLELASDSEVHAMGRVIRCAPSRASARTQYEIAFCFDDSVGLHLPAAGALVPALSGTEDDS